MPARRLTPRRGHQQARTTAPRYPLGSMAGVWARRAVRWSSMGFDIAAALADDAAERWHDAEREGVTIHSPDDERPTTAEASRAFQLAIKGDT